MPQNWFWWFWRSPKETERAETRALLEQLRHAQHASPLGTHEQASAFALEVVVEVCECRGGTPAAPLGTALYFTIFDLLHHDALIGELPPLDEVEHASLEEGVRLRAAFRRTERFLAAHARLLPLWREKVVQLFAGLLEYFPDAAFVDVHDDGTTDDDSIVLPKAPAYALCDRLPELLTRTMRTFFDDDVTDARLFEAVREAYARGKTHAIVVVSEGAKYPAIASTEAKSAPRV